MANRDLDRRKIQTDRQTDSQTNRQTDGRTEQTDAEAIDPQTDNTFRLGDVLRRCDFAYHSARKHFLCIINRQILFHKHVSIPFKRK